MLIGIALGLIIQPGLHSAVAAASAVAPTTHGGWLDFLKGIVPVNFLGIGADTSANGETLRTSISFNVLQIIVISIAVGAAAVRVGVGAEPFLQFNAAALAIFRRMLLWLIRLTPIGTAGLIGDAVARYGWDALGSLGRFAIAIYLGLALVLFVVYPLLLRPERPLAACFLPPCLARDAARLRLALVDRHAAGDAGRDAGRARRAGGLCLLRRAARRDHQDGRLRGDLSPPLPRSSSRNSTASRCTSNPMC